jgi:large subunit ribosomal protein L17
MRHGNSLRQLSRDQSHRDALLRNLTTALVLHERIETTVARAKELRKWADRIVTIGKHGRVTGAQAILFDDAATKKLMNVLVPRFQTRMGGYTRLLRVGPRKGDNAEMAVIEYVGREGELSREVRWSPTPASSKRSAAAVINVAAAVSSQAEPLAVVADPSSRATALPAAAAALPAAAAALPAAAAALPAAAAPIAPDQPRKQPVATYLPPRFCRPTNIPRGEWFCPSCNSHCSRVRVVCFRCGTPKPIMSPTQQHKPLQQR